MMNPGVALGLVRREIESGRTLSIAVRQIVSLIGHHLAYKIPLTRIDTLKSLPFYVWIEVVL